MLPTAYTIVLRGVTNVPLQDAGISVLNIDFGMEFDTILINKETSRHMYDFDICMPGIHRSFRFSTCENFTGMPGQVRNSTGQITPVIYQSNHCINASHESHIPITSPRRAKSPRYVAHRTRTRTYKSTQHIAAHATIGARSRNTTNPRSPYFVSGKAS